MNIKGITRNLMPLEVDRAKAPSRAIKSENSTDREGNGQQQQPEPEKRKLSEEELQAAIEHLEQLPGIKTNNLVVKRHTHDGITVVIIEDAYGKVIRRIPEIDLGQLLKNATKDKGHIFDRAM
jgi:uncharacterized FlaG/YvyC family protein